MSGWSTCRFARYGATIWPSCMSCRQGFQLIARSDELRVLARDLGETRARAAGLALTIQRATDDMALLVAGPHPEAARVGAQDARVEAARRSGTGEVSDRAATLAARVA